MNTRIRANAIAEPYAPQAPAQPIDLHLDANERVSPWSAARASMIAFTIGALIPLLAIVLTPQTLRLPLTVVAVLAALTPRGGRRK